MENREFSTLLSCLQANGVRCNEKFERAYTSEGCIGDYRAQFDGVVADMQAYLYAIANSPRGFTGGTRKELAAMTDLVVRISEQTGTEQFDAIMAACKKIRGNAQKKTAKKKKGTDMKNEVLKKIAAYKTAIGALKQVEIAVDRRPILDEILGKLTALETTLAGVVDGSSAEALERAKEIVAGLEKWGVKVSQHRHDASSPRELDAIISVAEQWAAQQQVKRGLFGSRKPVSFDEIRFDGDRYETADPMERIAQSATYIQDATLFNGVLAEYKRLFAESYGTETEEAKLEELRGQKKALEEKKQELLAKYNNGELSREDLGPMAADLRADLEDVELAISDLSEDISDRKAGWTAHRPIFDILEKLLGVIKRYEKTADLDMVSFIGEYIDFNAIDALVHGRTTAEDEASILVLQKAQALVDQQAKGTLREMAQKYREGRRAARTAQTRVGETLLGNTQQQQQRQEAHSEDLDWLLGAQQPQQPAAPQEQQPQQQTTEDFLDTLANPNGVRR